MVYNCIYFNWYSTQIMTSSNIILFYRQGTWDLKITCLKQIYVARYTHGAFWSKTNIALKR